MFKVFPLESEISSNLRPQPLQYIVFSLTTFALSPPFRMVSPHWNVASSPSPPTHTLPVLLRAVLPAPSMEHSWKGRGVLSDHSGLCAPPPGCVCSQTTQASRFSSKVSIHCPLIAWHVHLFSSAGGKAPRAAGSWPLLASTCQPAPRRGRDPGGGSGNTYELN